MNLVETQATEIAGCFHEIVLIEQWGIRFFTLAKANLWIPVLKDGSWEKMQREFFTSESKRRGCAKCIDVGANNGIYSLLMCNEKHIDTVFSFEPCEPHFSLMRKSVHLNGFTDKSELYRIACSDMKSSKQMYVFPAKTPSLNQLVETKINSDSHIAELGGRLKHVETTRLDDILSIECTSLAIKIDTEGHELNVIRGAERLIRKNSCFIQVESFNENIIGVMSDIKYRLVHKISNDYYFVNN